MDRRHRFGSFVLLLSAIWVLVVFADARAQGQGHEKDQNEKNKDKNKNEQAIERGSKGKSGEERGKKTAKEDKIKYKPRGMTDADMMEWTDGSPPGWSRGKKTGWGGAGAPPGQMKEQQTPEITPVYPPGSENWDTRRKEEWDRKLERSRARILERVRAREGMSREDEESAVLSINGAARKGVPLEHIETTMNRAIARGMHGRDIEKVTRAMSYGADKDVDYSRLDQFTGKKMDEGETGDDLALSIYKEIDEQHASKPEKPVKKSWWRRLFGG